MDKIDTYNLKFNEYYLNNLKRSMPGFHPSVITCKDWPIIKFNIGTISKKIYEKINPKCIEKIAYKLIDIKMVYVFLQIGENDLSRGPILIVGNNEVEKLNPNTLHLLQQVHYRVYLISVLTEMLLDLLQLIYSSKIEDHSKNKWNKIYKKLNPKIQNIFPASDFKKLVAFKNKYRTAELHKFSSIRGFISKSEWSHFQQEEKILQKIIARLSESFN
ncbi:MAG: hypothetical protein WCX46_03135 [Candidatus Paceibacterota bacterium]